MKAETKAPNPEPAGLFYQQADCNAEKGRRTAGDVTTVRPKQGTTVMDPGFEMWTALFMSSKQEVHMIAKLGDRLPSCRSFGRLGCRLRSLELVRFAWQ